jgi:hypothetical protein|tara:strand:- start:788 stop:1138 length:351 start_codon:yes stop_codon:yes gene_type:complete
MKKNQLDNIEKLIRNKNIQKAEIELSKLGPEFFKDSEYLYLRSKIFFINKLYYIAIDTLLIALEFKENDKIYDLISNIYNILGNENLSKQIGDSNLRVEAIDLLKSELTGISQKEQ